jgi:hypothetical protein
MKYVVSRSLRLDWGCIMSTARKIWVFLSLLAICVGRAHGGTVLTFEGLKNFEQVAGFYNGGKGSLGSGPGTNFGVTFTSDALAYIPGEQTGKVTPFPGDPSPPTVLLMFEPGNPFGAGFPISMTMNVSAGFSTALSFYDIAIGRAGSVTIWSGLDGTGTMLAKQALPITPAAFGGAQVLNFSGIAKSAVWTGGNDQFALDNIAFASVPEPSAWLLLCLGLGSSYLLFGARPKKAFGGTIRPLGQERSGPR